MPVHILPTVNAKLSPLESVYLRLVNETDLNYFSGVFQDDTSQKLFQDMFKSFLQFHFKKDSE